MHESKAKAEEIATSTMRIISAGYSVTISLQNILMDLRYYFSTYMLLSYQI